MRASVLGRGTAALVLVGLCLSASADAGRRKKKRPRADDERIDVSARAAEFEVYTDGEGGFFAVIPTDTDLLFYGDGKSFLRQRVSGGYRDGTVGSWSMRMWSPRTGGAADVEWTGTAGRLSCGDDTVDLVRLAPEEAAKVVAGATFRRELWKRQAHRLSRDDRGVYYYVDRFRNEYGGKGWRLFAGFKGAMKQLKLTNIVADSEGEIFSSKKGDLRFVQFSGGGATWVNGDDRTSLVDVPVEENAAMIYRDLGVYEGSLGTPCDDY